MSGKRILRDRAVLSQKSTNLSSAKYVYFKSKSNEKENCLLHANLKENRDSISSKKSIQLKKHENQSNRRSERKTLRQNSTAKINICALKDSNIFKEIKDPFDCLKTGGSANVLNQNQTVSGKNSIKSRKLAKNIKCTKNAVLSNVENTFSEKLMKAKKESNEIASNLKKIPIWKRNLSVLKPSKKLSSVDVYDISLDEEIASSKIQKKITRIHSSKNTKKENREKKKHLSTATKNLKTKAKEFSNLNPFDKKAVCKPDQMSIIKLGPIEPEKFIISENLPLKICQNKYNKVCVEQNDEQSSFCFPSANDTIESIDSQSSEPKNQRKMYLSMLADEIERSFSIPKMTSTPDGIIHSKIGMQVQTEKVINVSAISTTPANNWNCLNSTMVTPVSSDNNVISEATKNIEEIHLFESPEKPEVKKKNDNEVSSPKKTIQINLFGEVLRTPSSEGSSEDSVLVPKKAYHTPDNFKVHLIRTKRPVAKKEPKKTKQDWMIEKMSQHFDEIENTDLFIE